MASIANTLGVGSGVDTTALIDALVSADRAPRDAALKVRGDRAAARQAGLGQIGSALDALVAAMASRTRGGALGPLPGSSDTGVITARATAGATRNLQPTSIEVRALAGGQSLVSAALASAAAPVGQGTLSLTLGRMTPDGDGFTFAGVAAGTEIVIGPGDDSLTGLAAAINRAQTSVRASIVDDGSGARLSLKGPTGAASAFILTASGDPGLDRFVHAPAASAMTVAATARDADLRVDGIAVTRPTNSVADLIPGVRLDLVRAAAGTAVTVAATRDTGGLASAVGDLADALNALHDLNATLTRGASNGEAAGALAGDATVRGLQRQLSGLTVGAGGLASVGLTTQRSGQVSVDTARLAKALEADPDGVEALLVRLTAPGGALVGALGALGSGATDRLAREQRGIANEQAAQETRSAALRTQLTRQYAAMERAVGGFKATQSYLDQQIKAWNRDT
ncbi:flagellar filament capping protein FliD [Glacieibacterium frigidum]|uniref:Flagellar hook-associated protein 2 n=1 Tax=Glacieibacterium frigidum TaxID=2593303 RepID=A0A552U791_9SPHN|nr:flagellar filament capping protein FliD [Glacieibacterium frigidum]TRW14086.1 hypothetical protein FMM06_10155 [Glacieibacterium frigidum]